MADKLDFDGVVLDIEGTVCPISFVKDVLFPYALTSLDTHLSTSWDSPSFAPYRDAFPAEFRTSPSVFRSHVHDLVSRDVKISYLKNLQGHLWLSGYESGVLTCPLFADVLPALKKWHKAGKPIVIYSSGSVAAQKLLFKYTSAEGEDKDLTGLVSGWFDTVNAGMKGESGSYGRIVEGMKGKGKQIEVARWLFCSDRVEEVDAAREAGMQAVVVVREGNKELSESEKERHILIESFDQIGGGKAS
ncbi:HAD-like domain-containing protein [Rhexocercosporidium sp. MPI-PUGE-AT-0058]|nr:HAD-like domain-containing protein [Rhexocercosporidium sp. MPI-PUGE-AT-0058]